MSDDIYEDLKRHAEAVAHSLTWAGIAEQVFEDEYTDDDITRDDDGFWYDADGDELTDDEAFHAMTEDAPSATWLDDQLEVRKVGHADLYDDTMATVERVEVLITFGGPNIWADFCELSDDRVRIRCYWGSEEYTLYCTDEIGVSDYLEDVINNGC